MEKFRVKNSELVSKFNIKESMDTAIVAAIENPYIDRNGDSQTPILLIQQSNVRENEDDGNVIAALQGWNQGRLLRTITNVKTSLAGNLNIKVGEPLVVNGNPIQLSVERSFQPFYEGQEPMLNPQTGEILTSGGKDVYENTTIGFSQNHKNMDIEFDNTSSSQNVEVETVSSEESLLDS